MKVAKLETIEIASATGRKRQENDLNSKNKIRSEVM